jgi:hypothetical protein
MISADETETETLRNTRYLGTGEHIRTIIWRPSMVDPSRGYSRCMSRAAELYSPGPSTSLNHFYASCFAYIQALCMRHRDSILGASWHLVTYRGDQRERNQKQCTSVLHSKLDPKTSLKCVELRSSGLQKATGQEVFPASWISSTC